jgi:hypothetical protein
VGYVTLGGLGCSRMCRAHLQARIPYTEGGTHHVHESGGEGTIIDPVLQIFGSKPCRALRSRPFFSILLPMERPCLWLSEDVFFVFN